MSTMNYYVVLGIAEDADSDTIRSAFERWLGATTPTPGQVRRPMNSGERSRRTKR
jgi:hypothetical protein